MFINTDKFMIHAEVLTLSSFPPSGIFCYFCYFCYTTSVSEKEGSTCLLGCDSVFLVMTDVFLLAVIRACCSTSCFCVRDVSCDGAENHTPSYFLVVADRFSCKSPCAHDGQVHEVLRLDEKQLAMLLLNVYPCSERKLLEEMDMIGTERPEIVEALGGNDLLHLVEGNPGVLVKDDVDV